MINRNHIIIFLILFTSIFYADKSSSDIQKDINRKNNELETLKSEIKQVEQSISTKLKEEQLSNEIIKQINNKISLTEKLIKTLNDEENYLIKLIYKAEDKIKLKEKELFTLKNQLKNRVRHLYKYGKQNLISQMMQSDNWNKIIYRTKYLQILNEYEQIIKNRINNSLKELKNEKSSLQKEKQNKIKLINNKNNEFKNLENEKERKKIYLVKIRNQKNELRKNLQIKKDMMAEVENIIKRLYSDKGEAKKREEEITKERYYFN